MMEVTALMTWQVHAEAAVRAFRLGMEGLAGERLAAMIDALAPALDELESKQVLTLQPVLEEILAGQTRKDWLRIADLLEYVVVPGFEPRSGNPKG